MDPVGGGATRKGSWPHRHPFRSWDHRRRTALDLKDVNQLGRNPCRGPSGLAVLRSGHVRWPGRPTNRAVRENPRLGPLCPASPMRERLAGEAVEWRTGESEMGGADDGILSPHFRCRCHRTKPAGTQG